MSFAVIGKHASAISGPAGSDQCRMKRGYGTKRVCALVLSLILLVQFLPGAVLAEEDRVVLTIGDKSNRTNTRMSGDVRQVSAGHAGRIVFLG